MSYTFNDTVDTAKNVMETAKDGVYQAVPRARRGILDGIQAAAGLLTVVRGLGIDDALGWIGLARRRSPFGSFAAFGAGFVVGTGVGFLTAPMSGAEMRKSLLDRVYGLKQQALHTIESFQGQASSVEKKAEDIASRAKDKAEDIAGKAKDKAEDIASKAKDKAEGIASKAKDKAEDIASKAKDKAEDVANKAKSANPAYRSKESDESPVSNGRNGTWQSDSTGQRTTTPFPTTR